MDEFAKTLLLGVPNLAFAVWIVWWMSKRLDHQQQRNDELTDKLLEVALERDDLRAELNGKNGDPPAPPHQDGAKP